MTKSEQVQVLIMDNNIDRSIVTIATDGNGHGLLIDRCNETCGNPEFSEKPVEELKDIVIGQFKSDISSLFS